MQHYVPPAKHKKGETVKFEKFAAEIPQVEETLGFYWTQTFVPTARALLKASSTMRASWSPPTGAVKSSTLTAWR